MGLGVVKTHTAMRSYAKFIAELFVEAVWDPSLSIPNSRFDRKYNIYCFSIAKRITDPTNYWIEWGGWFDNPETGNVQLFFNVFLTQVELPETLVALPNSFWIDITNQLCYINIPLRPWQYYRALVALSGSLSSSFSTAPKNSDNPSDIFYDSLKVDPTMSIPKLQNKINDIISGVFSYNDFSVSVNNSDGQYDGLDILSYFNTPFQISKTTEDAQSKDDYKKIKKGLVSDIKIAFDAMEIEASDQFYMMTKDVCEKTTTADFPNIEDNNLNKYIPVGWGAIKGVDPLEVAKDTNDPAEWIDYIALDKEYITSVQDVFDEEGNSLTFTFNASTGIIRVTSLDDDGKVIKAEYMNVTGRSNNKIGEIIIDVLDEKEKIPYVVGLWDLVETDYYLSICDRISFYFDSGTTKDLIEKVLKNDNAFLITKNDGLLTIRRWGEEYDTHIIPSWLMTKKPQKNFQDATKFYASSIKVSYDVFQKDSIYEASFLNSRLELDLYEKYKKSFTAEFETDLINAIDAENLSERLLDRFGDLRETLKISLGVDTFEINPLDRIEIDLVVNDRAFSEYNVFVVKSIDPGQDEIEMEGFLKWLQYQMTLDGEPALLDSKDWISSIKKMDLL